MRRSVLLTAALVVVAGSSTVGAQSTQPSTSPALGTGTFPVCVTLTGPVTPLTPETLTQGIVDGTYVVEALGSGCTDVQPSPGPLTLVVDATELSFSPDTPSVTSGDLTIVLRNTGALAHNLTIDALGIQVVAARGTTHEVTVPAVQPGAYPFYCSISGHREAGMEGTLTVLP